MKLELDLPEALSERIQVQCESECRTFKAQILKIISDGCYINRAQLGGKLHIYLDQDNYELLEEIARRYKLPTPVEAIKKWIAEERRHW